MSRNQLAVDKTYQFNTATANTGTLALDVAPITNPVVTLQTGLASSGNTVVLAFTATANLPNGVYIQIDSEKMYITSGGGAMVIGNNTLTVTRGAWSTTAASHTTSATVTVPGYKHLNLLPIASVPNQNFYGSKVTTDINYVVVSANSGAGDTFPQGAPTIILADSSSNLGTFHLVAPAGSHIWLLSAGAGAAGASSGGGGSPVPEAPYTVTLTEVGPRALNLADQTTTTTLQAVIQEAIVPGSGYGLGTSLHVQLSADGGSHWYDMGQGIWTSDRVDEDGTHTYFQTTVNVTGVMVNTVATSYKARAWSLSQYVDNGPAGAVNSGTCTVGLIGAPSATGATISITSPVAKIDVTTGWQWWEQTITVRTPGNGDPNCKAYQVTVQQCNSSGVGGPSGDTNGNERPWFDFPNDGDTHIQTIEGSYVAAGSAYTFTNYKVYGYSRSATTLPAWQDPTYSVLQQWSGGGTSDLISFSAIPSASLDLRRANPISFDPTLKQRGTDGVMGLNSSNLANMVLNSGFETGDLSGWANGGSGGIAVVTTPVYSGSYACQLTPAGTGVSVVGESQYHACVPGNQFYVEVYVRSTSSAVGQPVIAINYFDGSGLFVSANYIALATGARTSYVKLSGNFTIPSGCSQVGLQIYCQSETGTGALWYVDSVWLQPQTSTGSGTQPNGSGGVALQYGSGLHDDGSGNAAQYLAPLGGLSFDGSGRSTANLGYTMQINGSNQIVLSNLPAVAGLPFVPSATYPAGSVICDTVAGTDPSTGLATPAYTLYRNPTGSQWVASHTPADMVAGAIATGVTLAAAQITAGTLVSGVVYAGQINCSQLNAGTIAAAISLTSPTISVTGGSPNYATVEIDSTNAVKVTDNFSNRYYALVLPGSVGVSGTTGGFVTVNMVSSSGGYYQGQLKLTDGNGGAGWSLLAHLISSARGGGGGVIVPSTADGYITGTLIPSGTSIAIPYYVV